MQKFSELVDFLLVLLYDYEQHRFKVKLTVGEYLPLDLVAADMVDPVPRQWLTDAAKILETRGMAECVYTFGGGCRARITGLGRLEVEQNKANLLQELKANMKKLLLRRGPTEANETIEQERKPAFELVNTIKQKVKDDNAIEEHEKEDLLFDLSTVESQLKRREPNRPLLAAVLDEFSRVPSVSNEVASLVKLLNP